ncbi:MAG: histidine kinase [Anaerolineales bacterium]
MKPSPNTLTFWDYLTLSVRWIFLLLLAFIKAVNFPFDMFLLIVGIINLGLLLWFTYLPLAQVGRVLSVVLDLLVSGLVLWSGGERYYLLGWFSILPFLSAGLTFPWHGLILIGLLDFIGHAWLFITRAIASQFSIFALAYSISYLFLGSGLGFLLQHVRRRETLRAAPVTPKPPPSQALENERRKAFYRLISTLSATLNYDRVLETALDASTQALVSDDGSESQLVSAVLMITEENPAEPQLHVVTARHFTPADQRITFTPNSRILQQAIENDQPTLVNHPMRDRELSRVIALRSCKAVYLLPLRKGIQVYGLLLYAHPQADYFNAERCEILQIIANQAMVAIQNALLYQQLEEEKERIVEIQEEARKKLARDLHDGPTQSVSALAMRVNFARRLLERDQRATAEELYKIEELARRTTKEIRHMLFTLRPLVLESQGLIAALQAMAEKMLETYNQKVIVQADPTTIEELEINKQSVIFAIAEEAVNNARKHSQADHIWVRLNFAAGDILLLEVADDGIGFDPATLARGYEQRGSLGMINMRERTELVNGLFQIDSTPNEGTTVRVWIPLSEDAADRLRKGSIS